MAHKILLFYTCLLFSFISNAQDIPINIASKTPELINLDYDTDLLTPEFFAKNRAALRQLMPKNSVAVFFANPIRNRSNDVDYEYHQDPNFYYLSGLREPHAVLLIFKETQQFGDETKTDEILFLQKRDAGDEVWTGKRQGTEGTIKFLGINAALTGAEFSSFETEFESFDKILITELPEDVKNLDQKDDLYNLIGSFKLKTEKIPAKIDNQDLKYMMAQLRQIKSEEEIVLLKKAIEMTCDAQIELMKALKPGMTEYESEAIIEYVFKKNGAEYPGFPSILGGGENSCILHYTSNRKPLKGNDMLVSDIGAEYHGYTADVTRTLPTDGSFSEEERIIYNIVYEAQQAGISKCKAGNKFWDPHNAATEIISAKLMELGIIDKAYKVREYFMHGTSHYLGLDVHDAGLYTPLEKGNVITVEPGIYIAEGSNCDPKWWNIGVRIEDDILITGGEPITLSAKAPRTIEEIEALMKEESKFE
tara:strand:+ start:2588 stop:4021 length:1434 start_codon:yes stop_codon:yes gene_type:complete